ncbi:MAG: ATP-binding protein [Smithellaceae bacterium]
MNRTTPDNHPLSDSFLNRSDNKYGLIRVLLPACMIALPLFIFLSPAAIPMSVRLAVIVPVFIGLAGLFFLNLQKISLFKETRRLLETEIQLRQSEHRFKELFENMSSCVAVYETRDNGRDFIFKEINAAAESAEGIDRRDIIGKSVTDVFEGVRAFGLFDLLQRVWRTGSAETLQARYYRADRRRGCKENHAYRLPTGEVVVVYDDVSERLRAEEALKRSEETFTKAFKANPTPMFLCRPDDGHILDVNAAFEKLTGYSRDEAVGRLSAKMNLWADEHQRNQIWEGISQNHSVMEQEVSLLTKGGQEIVVRYSAEAIQLTTGSCLLSIMVDITAAKQAREESQKLEKQLFESQKMEAIGTLAGGVAHDFNNILGAIIGYAEMAAHQPDPKKIRRYIEQILSASDRAKHLILQILTFSRHNEHCKKPMDLRIITKETLKLLRATLPASIDIRCHTESIPYTINADPTQMHQIIMNICTNAAHAMGEKAGVLELILSKDNIGLPLASTLNLNAGTYVKIRISDTGCGMDASVASRIFDPFFSTKNPGEGTGLGLSVVYGIVKHHAGAIQVSSQPGRGTIFSVYLPFLEEKATGPEINDADPVVGGQERILFVDDEQALVELARHNLSDLGYDITACSDSRKALSIYQSDPDGFDLIITDMTMPKISGRELTHQIAKIKPDQSIIMCSGYSEYMDRNKAAQMGIKAYMLKPLSRKILATTIRKVLDGD